MPLTEISINDLHGYKKVVLNFNKDLNLLVGKNGSGKTTVINIISAVLQGNLVAILKYSFKDITIKYSNNANKENSIVIKRTDEDNIEYTWNSKKFVFQAKELMTEFLTEKNMGTTLKKEGVNNSLFSGCVQKVKNENPVFFLSLNRDINDRNQLNGTHISSNLDESIERINILITRKNYEIIQKYEEINKKMSDEFFETIFEYVDSLPNSTEKATLPQGKELIGLKSALKDAGLNSKGFDQFMKKLSADVTNYMKLEENETNEDSVDSKKNIDSRLFINLSQFVKLKKLSNIAIEANEKKKNYFEPMQKFLDTTNSFLNDTGKEIFYDKKRNQLAFRIFEYKNHVFNLENLSSGEKQVIIFFAYVIFNIDNENKALSTFIIDEPELSLHLHWQKRFCETIINLSPEHQFIFATHSPEVIGGYRKKCVFVGGRKQNG